MKRNGRPALFHLRKRRRGMSSMEVVLFMGSIFILALLVFWFGEFAFAALFQMTAAHVGSPYL